LSRNGSELNSKIKKKLREEKEKGGEKKGPRTKGTTDMKPSTSLKKEFLH